MNRQKAVLGAMVAQYSAELHTAWLRGLSPHQVRKLKHSLGGARECLALLQRGPTRRRWPA